MSTPATPPRRGSASSPAVPATIGPDLGRVWAAGNAGSRPEFARIRASSRARIGTQRGPDEQRVIPESTMNMIYDDRMISVRALAADYDGTLADRGAVDAPTWDALGRLRASGRKLVLVTGRELPELLDVCPGIGGFDRVVAENGALLYRPEDRTEQVLALRPPDGFVEALRARGVGPISAGRAIVATWQPHAEAVEATISEMGLDLRVVLNKRAVMVLPSGVDKASGLAVALAELGLGPRDALGVGDAENDLAFLLACGRSAAVANALPELKARVDLVTRGQRGAGVAELIDGLLADDR